MNSELKCSSKSQARMSGQKFYFTGKACPQGHDEGRRVQDSRCKICYNAKRNRLKGQWQHRKIIARHKALFEIVWRECFWIVLVKHQEWARKQAWHDGAAERRRLYRRKRDKLRSTPEHRRAYRERNHEAVRRRERAAEHLRRARQLQAGGTFTATDLDRLFQAQKGRCYWCRLSILEGYHVDHVWPLAKGGSNGPENLVLACPSCNQQKHAKTPMEWAGRLL